MAKGYKLGLATQATLFALAGLLGVALMRADFSLVEDSAIYTSLKQVQTMSFGARAVVRQLAGKPPLAEETERLEQLKDSNFPLLALGQMNPDAPMFNEDEDEPQLRTRKPVSLVGPAPVSTLAEETSTSNNFMVVHLKSDPRALMVEATLNRKVSGTFIVDTGATYTSINRKMAEDLGLDLENADTVTITTANGRIRVPKVHISRLTLNGVEARDIEATVIDVKNNTSFGGLLGLSFIRKFKMTIDPVEGKLLFQPLNTVQATATPSNTGTSKKVSDRASRLAEVS